jgi:hypothetical protein
MKKDFKLFTLVFLTTFLVLNTVRILITNA